MDLKADHVSMKDIVKVQDIREIVITDHLQCLHGDCLLVMNEKEIIL